MPPTTKTKTSLATRPVKYPDVVIEICNSKLTQKDAKPSITMIKAKILLGWETEDAYAARMIKADPKLKPEDCKFDGMTPSGKIINSLLEDMDKKKVVCWNNTHNRPLTLADVMKYCQDVLTGNFMFNLENIIVSKTEAINSGQHRLIALILACQMWRKNPEKYPFWKEEPTIDSTIAYGAEEDPKTLRTIDNVKTRTLTDVFYTSPIFADKSNVDKKELSRMLDAAVDLLWKRTGSKTHDLYQTHSASLDFFDRHKKIEEAVASIFDSNVERVLSAPPLELSPGQCSAMLYLMGASASDIGQYSQATPPSEKHLDFSSWDKARKYWNLIAAKAPTTIVIGEALKLLTDENTLTGLTQAMKLAVLVKAWNEYAYDGALTIENLALQLSEPDNDGRRKLLECPVVGGIDVGVEIKEKAETEPTAEEIKAAKDAIRAQKAKAMKDRVRAAQGGRGLPPKQEVAGGGQAPTPTSPTVTKGETDKIQVLKDKLAALRSAAPKLPAAPGGKK